MNFIYTTNWRFDTRLPMAKCIKDLPILTEDQLLDKIFQWDLFLEKLHGINWSVNNDLLQEFEDRCDSNYDMLQDAHEDYLREECGYVSIEWVVDGWSNFCLEYYKEEVPAYKIPLLANDWE
jgi:hypothetical protein